MGSYTATAVQRGSAPGLLGQTGLLCNRTPPHGPPPPADSAQKAEVKRANITALSSHVTTLHRLLPWPTNSNHHLTLY